MIKMKQYKTPLIISLATSLLIGCAGSRPSQYKILKEPPSYEEILRGYSFGDRNLPHELKDMFNVRLRQGYNKSFKQFLEGVDGADGLNDNYLTQEGLTRFLSSEAFDELDRETNSNLGDKFKE